MALSGDRPNSAGGPDKHKRVISFCDVLRIELDDRCRTLRLGVTRQTVLRGRAGNSVGSPLSTDRARRGWPPLATEFLESEFLRARPKPRGVSALLGPKPSQRRLAWKDASMKLRLGVLLWLLSWLPYGVILEWFFKMPDWLFVVCWVFEIGLGLYGISLAGSEFARAVKQRGWKHAPKVAWDALIHGNKVETAR